LLNGKQQATDTFKLFVSTRPLSTYLLEMQHAIKLGEKVNYPKTRSAINGLINKDKTIQSLRVAENECFVEDWFCKTMEVHSISNRIPAASSDTEIVGTSETEIAPAMYVSSLLDEERVDNAISNAGAKSYENSALPSTIKVWPHNSFSGDFNVNQHQITRSTNDFNAILQRAENKEVLLFNFNNQSTRSAERIEVLEISNYKNEETLKSNPLQIQIKSDQQDVSFLPITFDGEHILPIGSSTNDGQGNINIEINDLPESFQNKRSVVKAIKLYFVKTMMGKKDMTKLQWVNFEKEIPERQSGKLIEKIASAQNIVLLIHGIIGDTKPFLPSIRTAVDNGTADLVLTFDYENLNTPIEQTASILKNKLNQVGVNEISNKKLTIVAHSMGGLVARCFIENLSGDKIVNRLIMAGTPNMGSKIADLTTYRNWATTLFTMAANSGFGITAAASILSILNFTKNLTVTLEQMQPSADLISGLQSSADPEVPYHIIAGDFVQYCKTCTPQEKRLVDKLYNASGMLFYGNEDHDIAVAVKSIESISQSRLPKPTVECVSCHHLNYFSVTESLDKIIHWIGFEDPMGVRT